MRSILRQPKANFATAKFGFKLVFSFLIIHNPLFVPINTIYINHILIHSASVIILNGRLDSLIKS